MRMQRQPSVTLLNCAGASGSCFPLEIFFFVVPLIKPTLILFGIYWLYIYIYIYVAVTGVSRCFQRASCTVSILFVQVCNDAALRQVRGVHEHGRTQAKLRTVLLPALLVV